MLVYWSVSKKHTKTHGLCLSNGQIFTLTCCGMRPFCHRGSGAFSMKIQFHQTFLTTLTKRWNIILIHEFPQPLVNSRYFGKPRGFWVIFRLPKNSLHSNFHLQQSEDHRWMCLVGRIWKTIGWPDRMWICFLFFFGDELYKKPSCELTHLIPSHFWRWFSFSQVGYVSSLEGKHIFHVFSFFFWSLRFFLRNVWEFSYKTWKGWELTTFQFVLETPHELRKENLLL